jgi:hypothetical protein
MKPTSLEEVENFMTKNGLILFENFNGPANKDLKTFYITMYRYTNEFSSIPENADLAPEDYYTKPGRDRSLRDIFLICKYYIGCSLKEFLDVTFEEGVAGNICTTIKKYLLWPKSKFTKYELFDKDISREEFMGLSTADLYALAGHTIKRFNSI